MTDNLKIPNEIRKEAEKIPNSKPRLPNIDGAVGRLIGKLEEKKLKPVKVHWYDRLWAWTSGKKTITGILLMVGGGLLCVGPGTQVIGYKLLGEGIFALGTSMAGVGITSKIQKINDPEAGQSVKTDFLSLVIQFLKKLLEFITKAK